MSAENARGMCAHPLLFSSVVASLIICGFLGYWTGMRSSGMVARNALFMELSALDDLRNSRIQEGIKKLEIISCKNGLVLLNSIGISKDSGTASVMAFLIEYRREWATKQAEWSYEERKLEHQLLGYAPPTRLVSALNKGASLDVVKKIIEADPGVIRRSEEHPVMGNPLCVAAYAQQTNVVHYLIAKGANVHVAISALRAAGESNAIAVIEKGMGFRSPQATNEMTR